MSTSTPIAITGLFDWCYQASELQSWFMTSWASTEIGSSVAVGCATSVRLDRVMVVTAVLREDKEALEDADERRLL